MLPLVFRRWISIGAQRLRGALFQPGCGTLWNLFAARMPTAMKTTMTRIWAILNGDSDCVGAIAFSAGTFAKSCATKTKTFRYSRSTAVTT